MRIELEKRPRFAVLSMASEAAGTAPNRCDSSQPPLRGAERCDRVADRPAEIVIIRRLGAAGCRRSIRIAYAFGAMQGRPIQQEPPVVRDVLDNAMHAEEAADLLDTRECGLEACNDKG